MAELTSARLALGVAHAAKLARNTALNAKLHGAAMPMFDLACAARARLLLGKVSEVHGASSP